MSDYIKREDAIKAFDPLQRQDWYTPWIVETLGDLPSADVVEVVRCKDCVSFYYSGMGGDNGITYCAKGIEMQPTDFCSYGERKEND